MGYYSPSASMNVNVKVFFRAAEALDLREPEYLDPIGLYLINEELYKEYENENFELWKILRRGGTLNLWQVDFLTSFPVLQKLHMEYMMEHMDEAYTEEEGQHLVKKPDSPDFEIYFG